MKIIGKSFVLVLVLVLFCLYSCGKNTFPRFDYNKSENPWITAYKDNMFFSCLKESYKNDTIFKLIEKMMHLIHMTV